jgi:hypothetical protein
VYLPKKVNESSGAPTPVGRIHRAMFTLHQDQAAREELMLDLDEIARHAARKMLAQALEK